RWRRILETVPPLPMTKTEDARPVLAAAAEILEPPKNQENPALYAVFPYRLFGVGRPSLDIARRTYASRRVKSHRGWHQEETQAACLGLADEAGQGLLEQLSDQYRAGRFPVNWGPNFDWIPDQDHGSNILMALQHMLLQWKDEALYVFPAWPADWNVEFKLHAPFETIVEGSFVEGKLARLETAPAERRSDIEGLKND
ncbi:MAG: hypothetical protein U9Q79_09630, partial [Candidatus Hydrogenedentes bacterium]|nr:hypothetical protein [Candidatus Hydrogenedentota bacterium]